MMVDRAMRSMADEIDLLKMQHSALELELSQELARPIPDAVRIADLKKRKLCLKDRIEQLRQQFLRRWG